MDDDPPNTSISEQRHCESNSAAEIVQLRRESEIVKDVNPFRLAEIAIELQIERLRVVEITRARDTALQRLEECCAIIRQKNEYIKQFQDDCDGGHTSIDVVHQADRFSGDVTEVEQLKAHICSLETRNEELRVSVAKLRAFSKVDLPPCYESEERKVTSVEAAVQTDTGTVKTDVVSENFRKRMQYTSPETDDPKESIDARNAFLASIPLPETPPDSTLSAFVIPPPFTINDFLASAPISLREALGNHKILYNATTHWCPEREENGYMYCPLFRCSTNPRIATAHRWMAVDVIDCMDKPTECFYNKDGVWYYAGTYEAFMMDVLSVKEWAQLPAETVSGIVKETLADRKHICPQNNYETTQLYAAGALKVACVALLCVGFNQEVYQSILDYSVKFAESKWKSLANATAKILSGAVQSSPNATAKENRNTPSPVTTPGAPAMKTPIISKQFPRTPSLLSNPSSTTGSPLSRGGRIEIHNRIAATPPLGLGFGSSIWNMASNGRVNSMISLEIPESESIELPLD